MRDRADTHRVPSCMQGGPLGTLVTLPLLPLITLLSIFSAVAVGGTHSHVRIPDHLIWEAERLIQRWSCMSGTGEGRDAVSADGGGPGEPQDPPAAARPALRFHRPTAHGPDHHQHSPIFVRWWVPDASPAHANGYQHELCPGTLCLRGRSWRRRHRTTLPEATYQQDFDKACRRVGCILSTYSQSS